ncbi:MAG: hypothetical protein M3M89_05265 [Thermoproteota archaeon]|nr:hypothetical protein [Thermoproteota archaeon]
MGLVAKHVAKKGGVSNLKQGESGTTESGGDARTSSHSCSVSKQKALSAPAITSTRKQKTPSSSGGNPSSGEVGVVVVGVGDSSSSLLLLHQLVWQLVRLH